MRWSSVVATAFAVVACSSSSSDLSAARPAPCAVRTTPSGISVCEDTTCPTGQEQCGGVCTDTRTNAGNCGACGVTCSSGTSCVAGRCAVACDAPNVVCGVVCTDVKRDRLNCGACGHACVAGTACLATGCVAAATPFDPDAHEIAFVTARDELYYISPQVGVPTLYSRLVNGTSASKIVLGPEREPGSGSPSQTMSLGVDANGLHAAVGLNTGLVIVDIPSQRVTPVAGVGTVRSVHVGAQATYFFEDVGGRIFLRSYDLTTGDSSSAGVAADGMYGARLHPSERALYASWFPFGVRRFSIEGGRVTGLSTPVLAPDDCSSTGLWSDATGARLFSDCNAIYRAAPGEAQDGERVGTLGTFAYITDMLHDAVGHRLLVIAQDAKDRAAGLYVWRLFELDDVSYAIKREIRTPPLVVEGTTLTTQPKRVFLRADGRLLLVVDGVPEAGAPVHASGIATL